MTPAHAHARFIAFALPTKGPVLARARQDVARRACALAVGVPRCLTRMVDGQA